MENKPGMMSLTIRDIPENDHYYFKLACSRQARTISNAIRQFVKDYGRVERDKERRGE